MFFTTIEHRPTIHTQGKDATANRQTRRAEVYNTLLKRLDDISPLDNDRPHEAVFAGELDPRNR